MNARVDQSNFEDLPDYMRNVSLDGDYSFLFFI